MEITQPSHVDSRNLGWGPVIMEEASLEFKNICNATRQIREDDVVRVPKFAEGILVGGHILVMIFSLCGNTAALIIVLKSKAPKLSTKYFLCCLAISDLLMTLSSPPTEIAKLMNSYDAWVFGSLLCIIVPCVQLISATMSAICLMAIAVERNLLIVVAMHANSAKLSRLWDKWICPLISVSIIAIPVACGLPNIWSYTLVSFIPIPSSGVTTTPGPTPSSTQSPPSTGSDILTWISRENLNGSCNLRYQCSRTSFDSHNIIYYSVTGGTYFFLLGCFLICYISIYRFVRKHGNFRKQHQERSQSSPSTRRFSTSTSSNIISAPPPATPQETKLATAERHRKTLRLIIGFILLHICCRFPNWLYLVIINVVVPESDTQPMVTLRECLHLLTNINSALNPFLYVIWNHSLRATADEAGQHFGCCRWTRPHHHHHHQSGCSCHTKFFHSLQSFCCCGRYKRRAIGESDGSSESGGRFPLWKPANIYYVTEPSDDNHHGKHQRDIIPSVSTQRILVSDKNLL